MKESLKEMIKPRSDKLRPVADGMNMSFTVNPDMNIEKYAESFNFFNRGRSRQAKNMIFKNLESMEIKILDYEFTTGYGKHKERHKETAFLLESNNMILPKFHLYPRDNSQFLMFFDENWGDITGQIQESNLFSNLIKKIGRIWLKKESIIESRGILFESSPFLCSCYHISGSEEVAVRKLFNDDVIRYFELASKLNKDKGIFLEGCGGTLLYHRKFYHGDLKPKAPPKKDYLKAFIGEGLSIYSLLQSGTKINLDVLNKTANIETCLICGSSDLYRAYVEGYGQSDICRDCKKAIQPVKYEVWKMYMHSVSDKNSIN